MTVHGDEPMNRETSLAAHRGAVITPQPLFFVRNHFPVPSPDPAWRLRIGGLVERPLSLGLDELMAMAARTVTTTMECAGNARSTLSPPTEGVPWGYGAVSTAEWTGVLLADVLDLAGISPEATEVVLRGADAGCVDGRDEAVRFERSMTVDACRATGTLLAYEMNGAPLPVDHGYPLRVVVPGWYGVASVKWLTEIEAISGSFEGHFQTERYVYVRGRDVTPVTTQRVRAVIVAPCEGDDITTSALVVRGVAWSGDAEVARVEVAVGDGPWCAAAFGTDAGPYAWRWWELSTTVTAPGPLTIRARATDAAGNTQPDAPEWNCHGYGANAVHRIRVNVR